VAVNEDAKQSRVLDARRETFTTLVGESCPNCGTRIQRRDLYRHFAACPRRQEATHWRLLQLRVNVTMQSIRLRASHKI